MEKIIPRFGILMPALKTCLREEGWKVGKLEKGSHFHTLNFSFGEEYQLKITYIPSDNEKKRFVEEVFFRENIISLEDLRQILVEEKEIIVFLTNEIAKQTDDTTQCVKNIPMCVNV